MEYESDNREIRTNFVNCGDVQEEIDRLQNKEPDKRKKEWKIWKNQLNELFNKYNSLIEDKIYKLIN